MSVHRNQDRQENSFLTSQMLIEATWYLQYTFVLRAEIHHTPKMTSDVCLSWFMRSHEYYREEK